MCMSIEKYSNENIEDIFVSTKLFFLTLSTQVLIFSHVCMCFVSNHPVQNNLYTENELSVYIKLNQTITYRLTGEEISRIYI